MSQLPKVSPPVTMDSIGGVSALRVGDVIKAWGCPAWMVAVVDHEAHAVRLVRPVGDSIERWSCSFGFLHASHCLVLFRVPDGPGVAPATTSDSERPSTSLALRLFRVQDGDRPMHVVASTFSAAIERWRERLSDENPGDDFSEVLPYGVELVADVDELLLPPQPLNVADREAAGGGA